MLNIDTGAKQLDRLRLIDLKGMVLMDQKLPSKTLDISMQPLGVYLLQLYSGDYAVSKRIVIQ